MSKDRLPYTQFKFMQEIRHKHLVKVEAILEQFLGKCILRGRLAESKRKI